MKRTVHSARHDKTCMELLVRIVNIYATPDAIICKLQYFDCIFHARKRFQWPQCFRCKELQTLYLHHNSFTSLPSSLSRDSQSAVSAVEAQNKSEVQRSTIRNHYRTEGAGKFARACLRMVQARVQTSVVVLRREWLCMVQVHYSATTTRDKGSRVAGAALLNLLSGSLQTRLNFQRIIVKLRDLCREKKDKAAQPGRDFVR